MHILTSIYCEGRGVAKNVKKAYQWAMLAQACAHSDAEEFMASNTDQLSNNDIKNIEQNVYHWIRTQR